MNVWAAWDAALALQNDSQCGPNNTVSSASTAGSTTLASDPDFSCKEGLPKELPPSRWPHMQGFYTTPSQYSAPSLSRDRSTSTFIAAESTHNPPNPSWPGYQTSPSDNTYFPEWMEFSQRPSYHVRLPKPTPALSCPTPYCKPTELDVLDFVNLDSLLAPGLEVTQSGQCDLFIAPHKKYGLVALKKPRIAGNICEFDIIRRIEREAHVWAGIHHRYILPFIGILRWRGQIILVSPWVPGGTILNALHESSGIDRTQLLMNICVAVLHLHGKGIVHGDIKASNVLLQDSGSPLLCDLGLAKIVSNMETSTVMKGAGSIRYMAPELFLDDPKTTMSDVYAFGILIAEVLSGRPPYGSAGNSIALALNVLNRGYRPAKEPSHSPFGHSYDGLWHLAERCWAANPAERPSMEAVYNQLAGIMLFGTAGPLNRMDPTLQ